MEFTTLTDLENAIGSIYELTTTGKTSTLPGFWKPFHFVLLAMGMKRCKATGLELPPKISAYAARMHLWQALGLQAPLQVNERPAAGRFHPLVPLVDQERVDEVSAELVHIFQQASPESINSAEILVQELLGNCYAHAELSGFHGLACAQYWPKGQKAQIAIGDGGIGIRNSLSQNSRYSEDLSVWNSCELATLYEVTSKPGKGHSGYGLTLARQLLEQNTGAFFVISHDEFFYSKNGGGSCMSGTMRNPLNGTLLVLEWNTNIPLNVGEIYRSWPSNEEEYDEFDF